MGLRLARKIAHLTQKELAKRSGVPQDVLCRYETGVRKFAKAPYPLLSALAAALGISIDELVAIGAMPDPGPPPRIGRPRRDRPPHVEPIHDPT
jgi:transcriptional regulator with XRE-family HTH domain